MRKLVIFCSIVGLLYGCGLINVQENSKEKDIKKIKEISEPLLKICDKADFEIVKGVLVRYRGDFSKEAEVILPPEIKKIGQGAFGLSKSEKGKPVGQLATLHLTISKEIVLDKGAFTKTGPMKITFAEGRTYIEERAFFASVRTGISSEVILPDSVKVLKKDCFRNDLGGSYLYIKLGKGIQKIEDGALHGVTVDRIPDSVISIGKESFGEWGALPNDLPEGLETLGSHFIDITSGKMKIPSSVREIAPDAVWWPDGEKNHGYEVAEDNPYFKSDSKGWLYSKDGKTLYYAYLPDTNYVLPKGLGRIYKKGLVYGVDDFLKRAIKHIKGVKFI